MSTRTQVQVTKYFTLIPRNAIKKLINSATMLVCQSTTPPTVYIIYIYIYVQPAYKPAQRNHRQQLRRWCPPPLFVRIDYSSKWWCAGKLSYSQLKSHAIWVNRWRECSLPRRLLFTSASHIPLLFSIFYFWLHLTSVWNAWQTRTGFAHFRHLECQLLCPEQRWW